MATAAVVAPAPVLFGIESFPEVGSTAPSNAARKCMPPFPRCRGSKQGGADVPEGWTLCDGETEEDWVLCDESEALAVAGCPAGPTKTEGVSMQQLFEAKETRESVERALASLQKEEERAAIEEERQRERARRQKMREERERMEMEEQGKAKEEAEKVEKERAKAEIEAAKQRNKSSKTISKKKERGGRGVHATMSEDSDAIEEKLLLCASRKGRWASRC